MIETTHVAPHHGADVREAVLKRLEGAEGRILCKVAAALGVKAWIVLHDEGMTRIEVYNLSERVGWYSSTPERFAGWLDRL